MQQELAKQKDIEQQTDPSVHSQQSQSLSAEDSASEKQSRQDREIFQMIDQLEKSQNILQHFGILSQLVFRFLYISLPNILSFISMWMLNFYNITCTEKFKDENYVSAYALSYTYSNLLGFALILCLNNGLCAMCSQAIGSGNYKLASMYYQRSQIINLAFITVVVGFLYHTESIFSLFTTKEVAKLSQEFIRPYIPALYCYVIFDSTRNLFNSLKKFEISNYILFFTYTIHFVWVYYFMIEKNLRMEGLGIARSITEGLNAVLIIAVVFYLKFKYRNKPNSDIYKINFVLNKNSFKNLLQQLKLSIPMGSILYLDWVASDIQTIFVAATKNTDQLSGHSAYCSIFLLFVVVPLGVHITILTYLGQSMGKKDIKSCKQITKLATQSALYISVCISIISFIFENKITDSFTNTLGEQTYFKVCYRIFNYIIIHTCVQNMFLGAILRSSGLQNVALYTPIITYYLCGIPLQYFLVFYLKMGVTGSWMSFSITSFATSMSYLHKVLNINWNKQIALVDKNMQEQNQKILNQEE